MSLFKSLSSALKDGLADLEGDRASSSGHHQEQQHASSSGSPTATLGSALNGTHRALFIGINYTGSKAELRGCHTDVQNISTFLFQRFPAFSVANSLFLVDKPGTQPQSMPTRTNIIAAMKWLVKDARAGDSLFIHYSGHGTSANDVDGDEEDGKDEALVPVDYETAGLIVDDDIHRLLCDQIPEGARLTALMDCCHSGTMLDLPYMYTPQGDLSIAEVNRTAKASLGDIKEGLDLLKGKNKTDGGAGTPPQKSAAQEKTERERTTKGDVISFSGCRDDQTSADAQINNAFSGAMSWALIKTLTESSHDLTYTDLLRDMRKHLHGKYTQVPQRTCSFICCLLVDH
ncbi:peptidase C14, caspase domain-containing protein [Blastocladiella britannica]|nr:peptidase C14, caspase domain-containing protein [Blastocladiella britannica]